MAATTPKEASRYLTRLDGHIRRKTPELILLEDYYEGKQRLAFATSRFRSTFGNLFREFADNWCELVVNASVERLRIVGFQFEDGDADPTAAQIWADNGLSLGSRMAHTEAVKLGEAFLIVDDIQTVGDGSPLITVEHPTQVAVECHPANARLRLAALKEWTDYTGYIFANVYTADGVFRFQTNQAIGENRPSIDINDLVYPHDYVQTPAEFMAGDSAEWVPRVGEQFYRAHKFGVVPVIPLRNNPSIKHGGRSDIKNVIPIQDAVNKEIADMLIASEFAAFPQRYATGIEIPRDPETGRPANEDRFLAAVSRVWAVEDADVKFGEFAASDLRNYVVAVEMLIQHLAAQTRTPPHYLLGQSGNFPSGDSLTATEAGLVAKVKSKWIDFGDPWVEAQRLAMMIRNPEQAKKRCEVSWGDPEQRIQAQRIDGAVKMTTIGVPQQAIWEEIGATPDTIARWWRMKEDMKLPKYTTQFAPPPPPPPGAKPPNEGPEGNLEAQQAVEQAVRVTRVQD